MVLLSRFIVSLFLLLPLTLDTYCAVSEPELRVPQHTTIRIISQYSPLDVMKHELRKYEDDPALTSFETTAGGSSAQFVVLSPNYVARMSSSPSHVLEANQFDTFIRTAQIEKATLGNIGFNLCLPLSVLLVADKTDPSGNKTSASIIIMPRAKGNHLFKYLSSSSMLLDDKAKMLFELGKSLASFQNAFMRDIEGQYYTASHGDFHEGNIFGLPETSPGKPSTWLFSLIDCAGLTLKGMHPLMDPLYFIFRANYVLFSKAVQPDSLYDLTKSFYRGYLGNLSGDVNRTLYALLPDWRRIASTELTRTKGILFFNEALPNAHAYLSLFEPLNIRAAKSIFRTLGYEQEIQIPFRPALTPCCLGTVQYPSVVRALPQKADYTCSACVPKPDLTPCCLEGGQRTRVSDVSVVRKAEHSFKEKRSRGRRHSIGGMLFNEVPILRSFV
jgi:hypothetical protein